MTTAPREFAADAFILDAPGTYVSELQDGLIIGNRPGAMHYAIAVGVHHGPWKANRTSEVRPGQDFSLDSRVFQ